MSDLVFDSVPDNMRAKLGSDVVTGDVYRIADRIAEVSETVYGSRDRLLLTDRVADGWPDDGGFRYIVSEHCDDGVLRWVTGTNELDERLPTKLREMHSVPFEKRFKAAEAAEARAEAERENAELDRLVEEIGLPMQRDLEQTGFIQRQTSYSKRGTFGSGRGRGLILP